MRQRSKLQHPSKAILVHVPVETIDRLDFAAHSYRVTRSELIRQLLNVPINPGGPKRVEEVKREIAEEIFKKSWNQINLA